MTYTDNNSKNINNIKMNTSSLNNGPGDSDSELKSLLGSISSIDKTENEIPVSLSKNIKDPEQIKKDEERENFIKQTIVKSYLLNSNKTELTSEVLNNYIKLINDPKLQTEEEMKKFLLEESGKYISSFNNSENLKPTTPYEIKQSVSSISENINFSSTVRNLEQNISSIPVSNLQKAEESQSKDLKQQTKNDFETKKQLALEIKNSGFSVLDPEVVGPEKSQTNSAIYEAMQEEIGKEKLNKPFGFPDSKFRDIIAKFGAIEFSDKKPFPTNAKEKFLRGWEVVKQYKEFNGLPLNSSNIDEITNFSNAVLLMSGSSNSLMGYDSTGKPITQRDWLKQTGKYDEAIKLAYQMGADPHTGAFDYIGYAGGKQLDNGFIQMGSKTYTQNGNGVVKGSYSVNGKSYKYEILDQWGRHQSYQ